MTSRSISSVLLIATSLSLGIATAGCATPQDRCGEYVTAMQEVSIRCGLGQDEFDVVSSRDPDRIGCRYVSTLDEPRDIVRCINFLNQVTEEDCLDERLSEFPENLPMYCDPGAFGFSE